MSIANLEQIDKLLDVMSQIMVLVPPIIGTTVPINSEESSFLLSLNTSTKSLINDENVVSIAYTEWSNALEIMVDRVALLSIKNLNFIPSRSIYRDVLNKVSEFLVIYHAFNLPTVASAGYYNKLSKLNPIINFACFYSVDNVLSFDVKYTTIAFTVEPLVGLVDSYDNAWIGTYKMADLYNLWYYTKEKDYTVINFRGYYKYVNNIGVERYWNAYFTYNTLTNTYTYPKGTGNTATKNYNGLTETELEKLTLAYPTILV